MSGTKGGGAITEGLTPAEVAHEVAHVHGGEKHTDDQKTPWHEEIVEILEAVVLAIVAVAAAWSGYQTARWDGRQAHLYGLASKDHTFATLAATHSGQEELYDANTFSFWLQATAHRDAGEARLFERRFRPEFRPAFAAWLKTDPLHNPKAPPGPLVMPQYHNASAEKAERLEERGDVAFEAGTRARHRGDDYLRNTILLATVLFITALAMRLKVRKVRLGLLVVAAALLGVALYYVATFPLA
jgi:hypothetical protein